MEKNIDVSKESSSADRLNVSFKFTKKLSKAWSGNKLDESISSNAEKDYVISVDKKEIKSSAPKGKEKELVVPLIKKNKWNIPDSSNSENQDAESKLKQMAIQELISESKEQNELREKGDAQKDVAVPLILQNKIPEGFETDEKMDVSLRAEQSTLEDYERIPIEKFGLAVLKGMGWKEGDAIGASSNKKAAEPIQVQLRPKGLGLGADTSAANKLKERKKDDEKLQLKEGAYVHIIQAKGGYEGFYGQVLGLDVENARVIVKLSGKDEKPVTFPEFSVEVVSKKEFEKESKVINRATYEKYKKEHENGELEYRSKKQSREERDNSREREKSSKERKRPHDEKESEKRDSRSKEKRYSEKSSSSHQSSSSSKTWVQPQLRVRLIDEKYKKGRYFNEKLIVVDVLSPRNCTCRTESDKYLEDISPSMLETVIPRSENSYVMIVQGKHSGELCTILEKNKSKCLATVQFLSDRDQALQIEYDSICEYVGDVSAFD